MKFTKPKGAPGRKVCCPRGKIPSSPPWSSPPTASADRKRHRKFWMRVSNGLHRLPLPACNFTKKGISVHVRFAIYVDTRFRNKCDATKSTYLEEIPQIGFMLW
mmetsp:Transcript_54504/g.81173  ORF Transcript_54504/g.81173 Transcript_54504/m.81173 type:complete len:104 (-) Transcript_54504:371-682(-)